MNLLAIILLAASVNIPDDPAIRQLIITGGPQAERTLLDALPHSQGSNLVAVVKALGDLRSAGVVDACARHLDTATGDLKDVCLYALSRTTSPRAARLLRARLADDAVATAYLRHGESLAEIGRKTESARVALDLLRAKPPVVRCGAVALLTSVHGYAAQPTLLAMLDDPAPSVREQVSRQLSRMPSDIGLIAALQRATGEPRRLLFEAIARRGDPRNMALMIAGLGDEEASIQRAASLALHPMHGPQVDAEIAKALASPKSQAAALELLAARRARSQVGAVMPLLHNPSISKQAFAALGALAGPAEIEQLIALASKDEKVRDDATKAIAAAGPRIGDDARCIAALLKVPAWGLALLPAFGGKAALDAVMAATKGNDKDAAVRALADWRDESALEPLLALCRGETDLKLRVLAARGAIRIVQQSVIAKDEKAAWLQKIADAAPRPEEKQQAQAALKQLQSGKRRK
ncbi:MAG: hypothetical protein FJ395_18425 [Verrucomicrobia bacterium]|nr:hypothetical protein [Verrucomicrobiota bacterium]